MAGVDVVPFLTFVMITTYTPGPNTVSSASMGLISGYWKTLPYLMGITTGLMMIMVVCGNLSGFLVSIIPSLSFWLRMAGSTYIMWMAYKTLKISYSFDTIPDDRLRSAFIKGMSLQMLNPKVIICGITIYTTFLSPIITNPLWILLSALCLSINACIANSLWALFGSAIRKYVSDPRICGIINFCLSLLLVYSAISILRI